MNNNESSTDVLTQLSIHWNSTNGSDKENVLKQFSGLKNASALKQVLENIN